MLLTLAILSIKRFLMNYNDILKAMMSAHQKHSDEVAEMINAQLGTELKKRKINAFTSSPDNRRYQRCPKDYLVAFAQALNLNGAISASDFQAITTFTDDGLFKYFQEKHPNNGT